MIEARLQSCLAWSRCGRCAYGRSSHRYRNASAVVLSLLITCAASNAVGASREIDPALFRTPYMPYGVFDELPTISISVGESKIILAYAPGELALPQEQITAWITRSAQAVAGYYRRFPVSALRLLVIPIDGHGVCSGTTYSYRGAATKILIGRDATLSELEEDWILVHELVHLAFPNVPRQ